MTIRMSTSSGLQSPKRRGAVLIILAAVVFVSVTILGRFDQLWIVAGAAAICGVIQVVVAKALLEVISDGQRDRRHQLAFDDRLSELADAVADHTESLAAKRRSFEAQRAKLAAQRSTLATQKSDLAMQKSDLAEQRAELARLFAALGELSTDLDSRHVAFDTHSQSLDERLETLIGNNLRLSKMLETDAKAHHEARVRLFDNLMRDLHVLRKESGGTKTRAMRSEIELAKLGDQFSQSQKSLGQRVEQVESIGATRHGSVMHRMERYRRIHHRALAARDSTGVWPRRLVLQMTINRTGSTRLFDILRSHEDVYMEPLDFLWQELGLVGRRYPVGLSNIADADTSIISSGSLAVGVRSMRPHRGGMPDEASGTIAVEKAHPQFFDFDVSGFVDSTKQLASRHGVQLDVVYQVRRPIEVMWSMAEYKQRDPAWMGALTVDEIPALVKSEFAALWELRAELPGLVVDFDEVAPDHERMHQVGRLIAPDATSDDIDSWLSEAFSRTDRSALDSTAFVGVHAERSEIGPGGAWAELNHEVVEAQRLYDLFRGTQG